MIIWIRREGRDERYVGANGSGPRLSKQQLKLPVQLNFSNSYSRVEINWLYWLKHNFSPYQERTIPIQYAHNIAKTLLKLRCICVVMWCVHVFLCIASRLFVPGRRRIIYLVWHWPFCRSPRWLDHTSPWNAPTRTVPWVPTFRPLQSRAPPPWIPSWLTVCCVVSNSLLLLDLSHHQLQELIITPWLTDTGWLAEL